MDQLAQTLSGWMNTGVWMLVDMISTALGLAAIITGIAIVIRYFKKKRDDKLRETRIVLHDSPIVLSVALGRKSIYPDVENAILNIPALREKFTYPEKDSDDQIKKAIQKLSYDITIEEKLDISDPSALSETFSGQLQALDTGLMEAYEMAHSVAKPEILLFYCGPAVLCAKIGNLFANCNTVHLYHLNNGTYCYAGTF